MRNSYRKKPFIKEMNMKIGTLKAMAVLIGGTACSAGLFAAQPTVKSQTPTEAGTPTARDSAGAMAPAPGAMPSSSTPAAPMPAAANGAQNPAQLTDAEILGIVQAVDENEVAAASKAEKKKIGSDAMAYAKMLRKEHKADEAATKKIGKQIDAKPATSKTADELRAKGKDELSMLSSKDGSEFEKGYIDAMVNGHTEVLGLIDGTLMPNAHTDAVKSHLTEVRGHVAMHLEQGKRLQGAQASREE
jgi:putative membrane protein